MTDPPQVNHLGDLERLACDLLEHPFFSGVTPHDAHERDHALVDDA